MAHLRSTIVLSSLLLLGNVIFAQLQFESSLGVNYLNLNTLNISSNPRFNGSSNFIGANYSPEWNINDFLIGFDFVLAYANSEQDSFRISQSVFIGSLLFGKKFQLGDAIFLKLYAGYSYGGFGITSKVDNTINYNLITGYDNSISMNNNSHYFTAKIQTELFYLMFVSFSYNVSLLDTEWKGTNSTLNNAPSDKFNNSTVSIGYVFGRKK